MPRVHSILLWVVVALFPVQGVFAATCNDVNMNNPGADTSRATAGSELALDDTVWVSAERYELTLGAGQANFGELAGTEKDLSQRDWRGYSSVLNGPLPSPTPANSTMSYCEGATATALTATGENLLWYTSETGGTGVRTMVPATAAIGNTYYYFTQTVAGHTESARASVYVSVLAKPAAPAVADVAYCEGEMAVPLGPNSAAYYWYTTPTDGIGTTSAPIPLTDRPGEVTYYVAYKAGSCESARSPLTVTVSAKSAMPVVSDIHYCTDATAEPLTATGTGLRWYSAAAGGMGSATAPVPATSGAYYVTQNEGCESDRAALVVKIGSSLGAPLTQDVAYCQFVPATQLSASGTNLLWYAPGSMGSTTAPVPETSLPGTFTYYVTQSDAEGCESERAAVHVTVKGAPVEPEVVDLAYCLNEPVPALTAVGADLRWYTTAVGGAGSVTAPTPVTLKVGEVSYYVSQRDGCESQRAVLHVRVRNTDAPVVAPVTLCQGAVATPLSAGGTNLLWYVSGSVGSATAPTPETLVPGKTMYYVSQNDGCESAKAAVEVTVVGVPEADFTTRGGCAGTPMQVTLVPAESKTAFYTWNFYNAAEVKGDDPGPYEVLWHTPGAYMVTLMAYDGMCASKTEHVVTVGVAPEVKVSGGGMYCINNRVALHAEGAETYTWSPAALLSSAVGAEVMATFRGDAIYTVRGVDANGCVGMAEVGVRVDPGCRVVYVMPTAFTPNGDGRNDYFRVKTTDIPREFRMLVFNRVGQLVYEGHDPLVGWNGMVKGGLAPAGEYVWVMQVVSGDGGKVEQKGSVVLVR